MGLMWRSASLAAVAAVSSLAFCLVVQQQTPPYLSAVGRSLPNIRTSWQSVFLAPEEELPLDNPFALYERRIIAIGDLHGDLDHATQILRSVKLLSLTSDDWIGGNTILVQTGDIVDRGTDTIKLYHLMDKLRSQAEAAGGQVINLLGNHEIMNALGDWRYVTAEDIETFGSPTERAMVMRTGWIGQTWRANYSITARVPFIEESLSQATTSHLQRKSSRQFANIPLDKFSHSAASFVHGGITPGYLKALNTSTPVDHINEIGSSLMNSLLYQPALIIGGLPTNASQEQRKFWSAEGPMWDRTYATIANEAIVCRRAREACNMLGVRRLIMGHTPYFEGIHSRCDGMVILIDTGISKAYGGRLSALEISISLAQISTESQEGWLEKETIKALYADEGHESEIIAKYERTITV